MHWRKAGPDVFADITITAGADWGLERAHDLAYAVQAAVRERIEKADVMVHVAPAEEESEDLPTSVRRIAHRLGMHVHDIVVRSVGAERVLETHLG